MTYSYRGSRSRDSGPPKIESDTDQLSEADEEDVRHLFSELGIDEDIDEVLNGNKSVDILMQMELTHESARNYWKALLDNDEVYADVELTLVNGNDLKESYKANNVEMPAYDVFNAEEYIK